MKGLVFKETAVLCRWGGETQNFGLSQLIKVKLPYRLLHVKNLISFLFTSF